MDTEGAPLVAPAYSTTSQQLLLTNYLPTLEEEAEIRKDLQAATTELAALDLSVGGEESGHDHAAHRSQWTRFIQDHQIILSPLRRLPAEILGEIFLYASTRVVLSSFKKVLGGAAMIITRVSSLLRSVALGLPALWSDVVFKSTYWQDKPDPIREILRRSRDAPLKISCDISPNGNIELLEPILAESRRWRVVSMGIPPNHINRLHAVKNLIPILETFQLERYCRGLDVVIEGDWLENAPRLHSLNIKKYDFSLTRFAVPWSQLTSFQHIPCAKLDEELERLCRLTHLASYRVSVQKGTIPAYHQPAVLGNLRRLVLPDLFSPILFALLRTPRIEALDWHVRIVYSHPTSLAIPLLRSTLRQAPETLRHITIEVEDRTRHTKPMQREVWEDIALLLRDWQYPDTLNIGLQIQSTPMMVENFLPGLVLGQCSTSNDIPLLPELRSLTLWFEESLGWGRTHSLELSPETQNVIERLFGVLEKILESRNERPFSLLLATSRFSEAMWKAWSQHVQSLEHDFPMISLTRDSYFRPRPT